MVWRPAEHDDQRQEEQTNNHNDLDPSKLEVGFGIDSYWAEIEPNDNNNHDCDPDCDVDTVGPEMDDDTGSGKLTRDEDAKGVNRASQAQSRERTRCSEYSSRRWTRLRREDMC